MAMNTEISKLIVVGINHKTSTISEREIYQINRKEIRAALNYFKSIKDVEGTVIISTCNRLEFYLVLKPEVDPFSILNNFYCRNNIIDKPLNKKLFYLYNGIDTAKHLFKVAAGLDSMLTGEYQVQGQIKDCYSIACSEKTADKILHKLFHSAFRVGKAVRTRTKIGSCNQSLSGVAFKIIKEKLKKEDVITIVGVNQNTKIIAEKLSRAGFSHLLFVNRTLHKAEELADKYHGLAFSLDYIEEPLISSKCVFSCTGAPGYIITSDLINNIYTRIKQPKLLIDMAVPRDINAIGLIKDIEVVDLEGLKKYLEEEKKESSLDLPEAERIILNEANLFEVWNEFLLDDSLCIFQEKIETVRLQLLDETRMKVSGIEIDLLDKFSRSLVHRMKSIITQAVQTTPPDTKIKQEV
jgi:glutamyl-tRNA reductase